MQVGQLDQHQDSTGSNFGFGQFSAVRYRGQCFTPALPGFLSNIAFDRDVGSTDIKVYIDTTSSHLPAHAAGSELYSWIIPNAQLTTFGIYALPVPLKLTVGTEYCFYLAPFSGGVYTDDYHDVHGIGSGSVEITYSGSWANENLTFHYATYMQNVIVPAWKHMLAPRMFKPK